MLCENGKLPDKKMSRNYIMYIKQKRAGVKKKLFFFLKLSNSLGNSFCINIAKKKYSFVAKKKQLDSNINTIYYVYIVYLIYKKT